MRDGDPTECARGRRYCSPNSDSWPLSKSREANGRYRRTERSKLDALLYVKIGSLFEAARSEGITPKEKFIRAEKLQGELDEIFTAIV